MKTMRTIAIFTLSVLLAGCANTGTLSQKDQIVLAATIAGAAAGVPIGNAASTAANAGLYGGLIGAAAGFVVGETAVQYLDRQEKAVRLSKDATAGNIVVQRETPQALKLTLSRDAAFASGSNELSEQGKQTLDDVATLLKRYKKTRLTITGHTDSTGTALFNQSLSERRALAVASYMISKGVSADRIASSGMGESSPAYPNDSAANRAKNRRVEILITTPDQA
ncbi:OmpA family protein [Mariprofundus ferrooxydans]|uniref:Putative lipoprotein n=1 Tax=Mariprofundus ferrooxydans PV-1 TaxID=314345 RepID=Q0F1Z9_9PROT|nr:OmpA family protein [Mariprofundus ferrooxydans]EAU55751.1 putative lipoprotein [Mariprofundus ferrooxydans PV-1]KON47907.1 hypothetical protein AL013_05350 [Mariprofundus ferrooxydans]